MTKVAILMASYNGEKYIKNQILSLLQQTHENWVLYIRDDGSSDNTLEIIEQLALNDSRIRLVKDELGNLGAAKSFMKLCQCSDENFTIFCDQDDIWFERKIELLLKHANETLSDCTPGLVYSDGLGYDDLGGVITLPSISRVHAKDLRSLLFLNAGYQGCSMMMNRKLCDLAKNYRSQSYYMHDDVVTLLAHTFGHVSFLDKQLMLYRQHSNNVTGNIPSGIVSFLQRVFDSSRFVLSRKHYDEKKYFYNAYFDDLSEEQRSVFNQYLKFPDENRLGRLKLVLKGGFSEGGKYISLIIKTILRKSIDD